MFNLSMNYKMKEFHFKQYKPGEKDLNTVEHCSCISDDPGGDCGSAQGYFSSPCLLSEFDESDFPVCDLPAAPGQV
jgi:hypothetical protein